MIGWRGAIHLTDGADAGPERTMRLYRITVAGIEVVAEHPHTYRGENEGYGLAVCGDKLLIGHYPSGPVLGRDGEALQAVCYGEKITQLLGVGLNPYAYGEAQTLAVYAGAVWVGTIHGAIYSKDRRRSTPGGTTRCSVDQGRGRTPAPIATRSLRA